MEKGKIYGFQGKNGCGKSMLMRVICGLVIPTHGSVTIDGEQLGKELSFPRSLGMMIEKPGFLGSYTGLQNLEMLAAIRSELKKKEIEDVLARVGLEDVMHKNIGNIPRDETKIGNCRSDYGKARYFDFR